MLLAMFEISYSCSFFRVARPSGYDPRQDFPIVRVCCTRYDVTGETSGVSDEARTVTTDSSWLTLIDTYVPVSLATLNCTVMGPLYNARSSKKRILYSVHRLDYHKTRKRFYGTSYLPDYLYAAASFPYFIPPRDVTFYRNVYAIRN